MRPSYAVTKKARKSSRFYNTHRHAHVPNRANQTAAMLRNDASYGGSFGGLLKGLAMLGMLRHRSSKHAKGRAQKVVQQDGKS